MKYFNSLPLISKVDNNNNRVVVNNLLARCYFLPSLLKNVSLFYNYDIKESDTPEIIADKYYDSPYRYWMVLFSNNIIDTQSEWPLNSSQFTNYLKDKYAEAAGVLPVVEYTLSTIHHYEKIITTTDSVSMQNVVTTIEIDKDTYDSLIESTTERTFTTGQSVSQTITKNAVSIYNYELQLNEDKRKINILNNMYASDVEQQFQKLMSV
jgi:hypothetical protein